MTGKPRCFALQYFATHCLYQTDFDALLKNVVPNTLAFHCISIDYVDFCEGCESKKRKNAGCARTRTRARDAKDEDRCTIKYLSEVSFILLQASDKNIGRFPKNVGHFPKNVGSFSQNVGDNFKNVGDKFMNVQLSLWALLDKLKFRWIKEVYIWRNYQNLVPLPM